MHTRLRSLIYALVTGSIFLPLIAAAHEAYVLPKDFFWQEIAKPTNFFGPFAALNDPHNLLLTIEIVVGVAVVFLLNALFRRSAAGKKVHAFFERLAPHGSLLVRIAIAIAFFYGARGNEFLGPELSIAQMPFASFMHAGLYLSSAMILLGLGTEIAAAIGLVIFTAGFFAFGAYIGTYLNYLGELIVLLLFGARDFSFDRFLFGPLPSWRIVWQKYETVIMRVFYGLALIFAGVSVKFLHPELTLKVITEWNLTQFHWLFPHDPLLVALGAGLAEVAIGLFILVGFELRLTVLVSLFYITLSLLFFRELVWPHILLYGISFNLLVQPERFTLDTLLFRDTKMTPKEKA